MGSELELVDTDLRIKYGSSLMAGFVTGVVETSGYT
jgi:hypothetical protein